MDLNKLASFKTGHEVIDDEHQKLAETIVLVMEAIDSDELSQCKRLLDSFVEVAKVHFEKEEAVLREANYPGFEMHCLYHSRLLEQACTVKEMCGEMNDRGRLMECFNKMAEFFIDDVVKGDHAFVSHLVEVGAVRAQG